MKIFMITKTEKRNPITFQIFDHSPCFDSVCIWGCHKWMLWNRNQWLQTCSVSKYNSCRTDARTAQLCNFEQRNVTLCTLKNIFQTKRKILFYLDNWKMQEVASSTTNTKEEKKVFDEVDDIKYYIPPNILAKWLARISHMSKTLWIVPTKYIPH